MKEKIEFVNTRLNFFVESTLTEYSSPVGEFFKNFPFENYDLDGISIRPDEVTTLADGLDQYFKSHIIRYEFPSGYISVGYISSPEICMDKQRIDQLKNGFIPVCVWFLDPYIPNSNGYFSWDV